MEEARTFYDRIEIIFHQEDDGDDYGLELTDAMLANVDSEDFDWWYDLNGSFHAQFWTLEAANIGAQILVDMTKEEA